MAIILILVIAFIGGILYLSFAHEDAETKVLGLSFFLSLFLIGPFFSGILSIHAPIPMDSENTIEVVSIIISIVISLVALGIYKAIEEIKYRIRERRRDDKRATK